MYVTLSGTDIIFFTSGCAGSQMGSCGYLRKSSMRTSQLLLNQIQQGVLIAAYRHHVRAPGGCVHVAEDRLQGYYDDSVNVRVVGKGTYIGVEAVLDRTALGVRASGHGVILLC